MIEKEIIRGRNGISKHYRMDLEKGRPLWSPIFNKVIYLKWKKYPELEGTQKYQVQLQVVQRKVSGIISEPKLALKEETRTVLAMQNVPKERHNSGSK